MAEETKSIIIDVQVDTKDYNKEIGDVNTQIKFQREEIKELSVDFQNNGKRIAELEVSNKKLAESKRKLIKESQTESNSLNALRLKLAEQTKERNNLNTSSKEGAARFAELQGSIKGLNDQISGFEQEGGDFRRNVGNYPGLANRAGAAFSNLWKTLLANPLTLLVAGLAGLIKIFKESQTGAEFFRKAGAALNTTMGFLSDIVESLGGQLISLFEDPKQALIDFGNFLKTRILTQLEGMFEFIPQLGKAIQQLFEGDFAGAGETAANALGKVVFGVEDITEKVAQSVQTFKDFVQEVGEATNVAFGLENAMIANEKALADLQVTQAQSIASQKELNLLIEDQNASFDERLEAADRFAAVEAAQIAESIRLQTERIELLKAQNDLTNSTEEDIQRVRDAEIELANLQAASFEREVTNQNKRNTILNQQAAQAAKIEADRLKSIEKIAKAQAAADAKAKKDSDALLAAKEANDKAAVESLIQSVQAAADLGKSGALVALGIDTARAIGGLTAASEENPANGPTFGLAGIAQFAAGLLRIGTNIAKAKNLLTSKGGGTLSAASGGGGAGVPASIATPYIQSISDFNTSNVGGGILSQFSQSSLDQSAQAQITANAISRMPNPVVSVVDINTAQSSRSVKLAESTLG